MYMRIQAWNTNNTSKRCDNAILMHSLKCFDSMVCMQRLQVKILVICSQSNISSQNSYEKHSKYVGTNRQRS